jgi:hypothetical protein
MAPTGESTHRPTPRCAAAHPDDPSPCEGVQQVVRIVVGADEVLACIQHGARLYASVDGAEVYPVGPPDGPNAEAAREVVREATGMKPFFWMAATEPPAREPRHRLHGLRGIRFRRTP